MNDDGSGQCLNGRDITVFAKAGGVGHSDGKTIEITNSLIFNHCGNLL